MKIDIKLSTDSIRDAIRDLQYAKDDLQWGIEETLEILARDGADIAQIADGSMSYVMGYLYNNNTAKIQATGEATVIAEYGAGDATLLNNPFPNDPDVDVYPGSYSEQVGTGEYYRTRMMTGKGYWHFGGAVFHEVQPRQGMLKAKEYIMKESTNTAKAVIKL